MASDVWRLESLLEERCNASRLFLEQTTQYRTSTTKGIEGEVDDRHELVYVPVVVMLLGRRHC